MISLKINKALCGAKGEMNLELDLKIRQGEFLAISGESGAGKSTLLRILAGLEKAEGEVLVHGQDWEDIPVQKRQIGFVFQDFGLFENMSVEQNLLFVANDKELADELLDITQLSELKRRKPNTLSGGQKQRVALARAFMSRPNILLLDEPLSSLNHDMRLKLQKDILKLHQRFSCTTLMVSHDASDIYRMASRVIVMELGKIVKDGTAKEVFSTNTSHLKGEILEVKKDKIVILVGQQLIELEVSKDKKFNVGDYVDVGAYFDFCASANSGVQKIPQ